MILVLLVVIVAVSVPHVVDRGRSSRLAHEFVCFHLDQVNMLVIDELRLIRQLLHTLLADQILVEQLMLAMSCDSCIAR